MKRFIKIAAAVLFAVVVIPMLFTMCGDDPHYYIGNVTYDPEAKVLSWTDNSDADSWIVRINGKEQKTKEPRLSYDAQDSTFTVSIEGLHKKKGHEDNPTVHTTIYYLQPATGLKVENGQLRWNGVSGATGYYVYNNGMEVGNVSECAFTIPSGSFNLTVKPYCNGISYSYMSESLSGVILDSPTSISYQNGVFTWNEVYNADFYEVKINGQSFTSTTNSYAYPGNKKDIQISIASGSNQAGAFVSAPLEKTFYYLSPITTFSFDEQGSLVWPEVNNASDYLVTVNGIVSQAVTTPVFSDIQLDTYYTVTVEPRSEFSYTDTPTPYSFEKLSPVTGISFSEGKIAWDAHPRAVSYDVIINGEKQTVTDSFFSVGNIRNNLTIEVFANGEQENSRSFMSSKETYTYIPIIESLTVKDGALVWDASEGAVTYKLRFSDGTELNSTTTSYSQINPNQQYVVKVIPVGENDKCFSYWSAEFTFSVLAAPTVSYNQGVFSWNGSNDARGYVFRLINPDGAVVDTNLTREQFTKEQTFNKAGKYSIAVQTVADPTNVNVYDSAFCAPLYITQLADVTGHQILNSNQASESVQISANSVEFACGYKVYVNGQEVSSPAENTFALDLRSLSADDKETTFTIGIVATGKVTSNDIVLDSLKKYEFNVIRLATPANISINGTTVSWNNVNNATKYLISIDGVSYEASTSQYQLTNLSAGNHTIIVQAFNSNSSDYVPSSFSVPFTATKLPKPADVRIESAGSELLLRWSIVGGATGYQIKVGSNISDPVNATAYQISQHANALGAGEGVQVSVYAMGNGSNIIDSEPSDTITIARLNAPTNIGVSGDNIIWNPSEVDGVNATSYELYIDGQKTNVTGTSFPTADIPAGTHSIYVKAIGNKTTTLDSPNSGTITVTKLGDITNLTKAPGGNTYTWDAVSGASSYRVVVNGTESFVSTPSFRANFTTAGVQTITIQAIGKGVNTISGNVLTIEQQISALQTPIYVENADINNLDNYTFTIVKNGNTFTVHAKAGDDISATCEVTVDGIPHNGPFTMTIANYSYTAQVRFKFNGFGADGIYYIDSAISSEISVIYDPNAPVETTPQETEASQTEPQETEPQETEPQETEPQETEPQETELQGTESIQ